MGTGESLLRGILINPADDDARLVYADWLEDVEGGNDAARAEFVRLQIAAHSRGENAGAMALWNLLHSSEHWFTEPCKACRIDWDDWGVMHDETVHWEYKHNTNEFFARRGFVSEIRVSLAAFMEHAQALFSTHPITAVTLTDRQPHEWADWEGHPELPGTDVFSWYGDPGYGQFDVGRELMGEQGESDHATREDALAWLSARCVAYGRSLAGLPPLQQG